MQTGFSANTAPRFSEPNARTIRKFCTYIIDDGYHFRRACNHDTIIAVDDADHDYISRIEYDLAHDSADEVEVIEVRVYPSRDGAASKSPALQEVARQFLEDSKSRWEAACEYLEEHGDAIESRRAA